MSMEVSIDKVEDFFEFKGPVGHIFDVLFKDSIQVKGRVEFHLANGQVIVLRFNHENPFFKPKEEL